MSNVGVAYAIHKACRVVNKVDHLVKPLTTSQLEEVLNNDLVLESCTLEDIETTLFNGVPAAENFMLEAISCKKNKVKVTVAAFGRALDKELVGAGITADYRNAEVSKPRKVGIAAVMTAKVALSDGQSVSIVFHAPDDDPLVIKDSDTLIAFRFLMNSRDITHVVAPQGGSEISLAQVTKNIGNVVTANTDKFKAKQAENVALKAQIEDAETQGEQLESEIASINDQEVKLKDAIEVSNSNIDKIQKRIDKQDKLQESLQAEIDSIKAVKSIEPPTTTNQPDNNGSNNAIAGIIAELEAGQITLKDAKADISVEANKVGGDLQAAILNARGITRKTAYIEEVKRIVDGLNTHATGKVSSNESKGNAATPEPQQASNTDGFKATMADCLDNFKNGSVSLADTKKRIKSLLKDSPQTGGMLDRVNELLAQRAKAKFISAFNDVLDFEADAPVVDGIDFNNINFNMFDGRDDFGKSWAYVAKRNPQRLIDYVESDDTHGLTAANKENIVAAIKAKYMVQAEPESQQEPDTNPVSVLVGMGGNEWQGGDKHRVYFDEGTVAKLADLEIDQYGTGSISSAKFNGEKISNSLAYKMYSGRLYFDVNSGEFITELYKDKTAVNKAIEKLESVIQQNGMSKSEIDKGAAQAATSPDNADSQPSEAQQKAGNYKKGHVNFQGLDIAIENPQGSTRSGTDIDGNDWSITMNHHYGYIKKTLGADNEAVDVFIGNNSESQKVFIVNQINTNDGSFDEHKVMLGFDSITEAESAYKSNYEDGWDGLGSISEMSISEFQDWLKSGDTKSPTSGITKSTENSDDNFDSTEIENAVSTLNQINDQEVIENPKADLDRVNAAVEVLKAAGVEYKYEGLIGDITDKLISALMNVVKGLGA